jgi:peptidoglycan/LPS O-acetylase OafA/YrhL
MNKILELQALRFYAVMIAIFYHYSIYFHGGFAGVDIFFIISGFIIGKRYLLRDNFSLLDFYRRRVLRILPMATIALIFSTIVTFLTNREGFDKLFNTLLTLVTYTRNL